MNRAELKQLSSDRIADVEILLANRRWGAAYCLVGYAVETALTPGQKCAGINKNQKLMLETFTMQLRTFLMEFFHG